MGSADDFRLVDTVANLSNARDNIPESLGTARSGITCSALESIFSDCGSYYRCFPHLVRASPLGNLTDHRQGAPSSCRMSLHGRHSEQT